MLTATCELINYGDSNVDAKKHLWPTEFVCCPRPGDRVYSLGNEVYLTVQYVSHMNPTTCMGTDGVRHLTVPDLVIGLGGLLIPNKQK